MLEVYPLFRFLCTRRWIGWLIVSKVANYIFTARNFPGITLGMATGVPNLIFEYKIHRRMSEAKHIFLVSIAQFITMTQWFGYGAISHPPSCSPEDSFWLCKLTPPKQKMRSSHCRITFAVPSPRQNFRSLDFDLEKINPFLVAASRME